MTVKAPKMLSARDKLIDLGRADQRQRDVRLLLDLARQARQAREAPGSWSVCQLESALPESILLRVAALLENSPLGDADS